MHVHKLPGVRVEGFATPEKQEQGCRSKDWGDGIYIPLPGDS